MRKISGLALPGVPHRRFTHMGCAGRARRPACQGELSPVVRSLMPLSAAEFRIRKCLCHALAGQGMGGALFDLGRACPAIDTYGLPTHSDELLNLAAHALDELKTHGVDELHVELLLALLDNAIVLDIPLMYGETGAAMRSEHASLMGQHRIQHRLSDRDSAERQTHGEVIRQYRQTVLVWCGQAMQVASQMLFTNLPPRNPNPFKPNGRSSPAIELSRALAHARTESTAAPASSDLLTTASKNPVVEGWRQVARDAALAGHDTTPALAGRLTTQQAQALVGDVAAIVQALVVLDQRYKRIPGWQHLAECARLGWTALAASLDVNLGQPDYSIDDLGWRPMNKLIRSAGVRPGILGVLQAEHDLTVRLRAFPHLVNLRVVVDSQRLLSHQLTPFAARSQPALVDVWKARAATYTRIQQDLRELGGLIGTGELAAGEAATVVARLEKIKRDTIIEPRVLGGFQILFDRIDHRVADIVEEGFQRKAFAQRNALPRLAAGTGRATQPVRERFRPITRTEDLAIVHTVREQLRPTTSPRVNGPGASRADLQTALIHRPAGRRQPGAAPRL